MFLCPHRRFYDLLVSTIRNTIKREEFFVQTNLIRCELQLPKEFALSKSSMALI